MAEFVMEPELPELAKIKVIGVGGGGCNAVDWMFDTGLQNIEFYSINTDAQALRRYKCPNKIQIGSEVTRGRGCGGSPEIGRKCMEEAKTQIEEILQGADIVFVTSGLGGGTGTGGAPIVASLSRAMGILTVGVVTRPFRFEGPRRSLAADQGIEQLRKDCDTIVIVSNDRLIEVAGPKATLREAFGVSNNVLAQAVQSISDLVTVPGLINVDFNDIRTVMGNRGGAVMGVGAGKGENRAGEAVRKATSSPLLEKIVIDGARGVLVNITGGPDMTLGHVNEAMGMIYDVVDHEAQIIFGAVVDESIHDEMRVTIIATGFPDDPHRPLRSEGKEAAGQENIAAATPGVTISRGIPDDIALPSWLNVGESTLDSRPPARESVKSPAAPLASAPVQKAQAEQPVRDLPLAPMRGASRPASGNSGSLRQQVEDLRGETSQDSRMSPPLSGIQRPASLPPAQPSTGSSTAPAWQAAAPGRSASMPAKTVESNDSYYGKNQPTANKYRDSDEKPNVPIYNPTAQVRSSDADLSTPAAEDLEVPTFIRKRRSALFD